MDSATKIKNFVADDGTLLNACKMSKHDMCFWKFPLVQKGYFTLYCFPFRRKCII